MVTSGLGGIYPQNLKIGVIESVEHEEYDVSLYALVRPFVDVTEVRDVMVITSFLGQGEAMQGSDTPAASSEPASSGTASSDTASSGTASSGADSQASSSGTGETS